MTARRTTPDYAGLRQYRRARSTGRFVGVYNGEEAGFDTTDGEQPWSTVCEDHGEICSHTTLALAKSHAAEPEEWCSQCRAQVEPGNRPRRATVI